MVERLKLFIVAGEPSGDRIAGDLVDRLRAQSEIELIGIGGAELTERGLRSLFPMDDLAVMGFSDVLRRLPLLYWRLRQTVRAILRAQPDIVVLVDSQLFSHQVAKRVRAARPGQKMLLYVSPTVWVWKPERAAELAPLFDEILAVLPFEPQVLAQLGGPRSSYVGHPALHQIAWRDQQPERGPVLLLPGSRRGELRRHLPLIGRVVERLKDHPAVTGFVVPTPSHLQEVIRAAASDWAAPVEVISGADRYAAFASAVAAFATSGTVTLELALGGVPMVIPYAFDEGQNKRHQAVGKPDIGLPNIIYGQTIAPEFLFEAGLDPVAAIDAFEQLLDEPELRQAQVAAFAEIRALMQNGAPEAPRQDPADRVRAVLAQRSSIGV